MYSLDRIQQKKAVLIDQQGNSLIINTSLLPKGIKEGDMIFQHEGKYVVDKELTMQRQAIIRNKLKKLSNK